MDTKLLHYFIVIAQERNMTRAAEKLFVSQSSLSYHLSKLEADVGTPLFLRTKSDLLLTPAGELYLDAAKKVVDIKDRLYREIRTLDDQGTIRICINSLWGDRMMADILPTFQKSFPGLVFELLHSDDQEGIRKKLADGEVDCGLLSLPFWEAADKSRMEYLCADELLFAVPKQHPFVQQHPGAVLDQGELAAAFWGGAHPDLQKDLGQLPADGTAFPAATGSSAAPPVRGQRHSPDLHSGGTGSRGLLCAGVRTYDGGRDPLLFLPSPTDAAQCIDVPGKSSFPQAGAAFL